MVSLAVYANTLVNGFVFDDNLYIVRNLTVTHATALGFFQPNRASNVLRPVTFASLALNWAIGANRAFGYHVFNLLVEACVPVLLFLVLRKLLDELTQVETIAFVAALLFAVHPIHVEAVAWITGRSELLAGAFLLAAWLFHLHDRRIPSLLCFVLAMMSKESAVVFGPLVLAGDYARGKLKSLSGYGVIAAVTVLYLAVFWRLEGGRLGEKSIDFVDNPLAHLPATLRILNALRIAWKYIGLQVYPARLSCDYSYNAIVLYSKWQHLWPALMGTLLVLAALVWTLRNRQSGWFLAGAIYVLGFSVTANLIMPTGTIMAERLAYLPSAGFCLLAALIWNRLECHRKTLAWCVLAIAMTTLAVRTVVRNRDWRDGFSLFLSAVRAVPESTKMHANLGAEYMQRQQVKIAQAEFRTALRIFPDFAGGMEWYGLSLSQTGDDREARQLLVKALSLTRKDDSDYSLRAVNLAAVLMKAGENDDALKILDQVTRDSPDYGPAWSNRAVIHYQRGQIAAARSDAETALRLDSSNTQARNVLSALNAPVALLQQSGGMTGRKGKVQPE
jgi:tetratricopeptide (TPR) repeat protein